MALLETAGQGHPTGLSLLRARIRMAHVPPPRRGNLRLATWNIRQLGDGRRLDESIHMLAMIIASFDLVSIVEVKDDLTDVDRILKVLGEHWSIVFSDYL